MKIISILLLVALISCNSLYNLMRPPGEIRFIYQLVPGEVINVCKKCTKICRQEGLNKFVRGWQGEWRILHCICKNIEG